MSLIPLVEHAHVVERRTALTDAERTALGPLPPETARMVEKRLDEFVRGRHCARSALAKLGVDVGALAVVADRAPAWPAGVVGAITHCTGFAAAAVARAGALRGVGIDAQPVADEKSRAALQRTATDDEIALLTEPGDEMTARTLAFAAKECVYKALAPTVGGYFGFEAARIARAIPGAVTLELTRELHPTLPPGSAFAVRWAVAERVVYAALEWR